MIHSRIGFERKSNKSKSEFPLGDAFFFLWENEIHTSRHIYTHTYIHIYIYIYI